MAYPNSTSYIQSNVYWSDQQSETHPQCFVTPRSQDSVSTVMRILIEHDAPFNVRSGGHIPYTEGSNIANGVTVNLVHLNEVEISPDRQTVSVGPGNRWGNVTDVLEPMNLAVVGGRDMNVGVSGLALGGGISFFSGQRGWACDNVRRFEVVLASGDVIYASPNENNDLYWALRGGGGSNFGIVTRFELTAFDQGQMWFNNLSFPGSLNETVVPVFQNLTTQGLPVSPEAHSFMSINYNASDGKYTTNVGLLYTTVPSSVPEIYKPFQELPSALVNETDVGGVSDFLRRLSTPYGGRWTWANIVVSASFPPSFLAEMMQLYESRNVALWDESDGDDIVPALLFNAIPTNVLAAMQQNGGNPLGLESLGEALMIISFPTFWTEARNDELVETATLQLIADVAAKAEEHQVYHPYVYMNYANAKQKVFESYGNENYARLESVAKKYDPEGKIAKLWKGHLKLSE